MYENQTEDVILKRMMSNVANDIDKREGSVVYDSAMPAAIEFMLLYAMCDYYIKNSYGDTAERPYLIKRAKERGLSPELATYAQVKGIFTPAALEIPIGSRFSYDDVNYAVTEKISSGVFLLQCETAGTIGNKPTGNMISIDYIAGLQTAALSDVTIPGEDEETTEAFRKRYLASFENIAFGGNRADYIEKVNKINGVGGVKPYRAWKGGGTVKLVIINSEYKTPSIEMVNKVQTLIDPTVNAGDGLGIAPIDHVVTVFGVGAETINISAKLTYQNGWSFEECKTNIEVAIDDYFKDLAKNWADNENLIVRISQLETRILDVTGILDVEGTTINDTAANFTIPADSIPVRGSIHA